MAMSPHEKELLQAMHEMDKNNERRFSKLETKIDDSVNGRFKDLERRTGKLEDNQRWTVLAIIGAAPVPVPPPIPAVTNTISVPSSSSTI